jgi:hypothetical protein
MNERVRARVQRAVKDTLEPGEVVELAVLSHAGPMFYDPLLSMLNLFNMMRGKTKGRALILTDRRVLYAGAGLTASIKGVIASWPRGSAPIALEEQPGRGRLTVDGEQSDFRGATGAAAELVRAGAGAHTPAATPAEQPEP